MKTALLIDFGSTYTKLRAVDVDNARIIGAGQGPSTVATDITVGMVTALQDLEAHIGPLPRFTYRLASSSAAGGLRMVTVGLVRELTAEAARRAALGAGAKLVGTFAYRLTRGDVKKIEALSPDILLLAGGTDGGNSEVILHNAAALGTSSLACPIVYAGNRAAAEEAQRLLGGKTVIVAENVMPEFNVLNIEPARAAIRRVFIERIVHAKGIDRAQALFDQVLMPTPEAVMEAARLLADGWEGQPGLGPLLVVDPGGATTDVHSVADGQPTQPGIIPHGLPEPRVKRTVEGDLGMRHNIGAVAEAAGLEALARDAGLPADRVRQMVNALSREVERLPESDEERALDLALGRAAVRLAVQRHAGTLETVYTVQGPVQVQHGKDLREVATVIGTGGVLVHGADPGAILETALFDPAEPWSLRPRAPRLMLDRDYSLYACGLLAQVEPAAALRLGRSCLVPVHKESRHERTVGA
ncbi:MAG: methylaspartate mutase accessory protein GlmL [Pseudomonadota bacterium]